MHSYTRMKIIFLEGLLWLFLFHFGLMALSLEPGFLDFDNLPDTNFTCVGKVIGGYYADLEANCQMFHVCTIGQADEPMDIRFLCLNGTVFDQETRVCERIDEVDCSKSEQFYSLNLELYGNSGPILEESPEVAQETETPSIIIKSTTSSTTTTTTTTKRPAIRPTSSPYYTTNRPHAVTTLANKPQVISTHHFPVNAPDIRFNPEEINISLNPGAPPDIRTKHFLPQGFSDSSQDIVNDNVDSDEGQSVKVQKPERPHVSSSTSPKSIYAIDNSDNENLPQNSEVNFGFSEEEYATELPQQRQQQFLIQTNSFRHSQSFPPNIKHNVNQYHHQHFHSTTAKQPSNFHQDPDHTTIQTIYLHSLKPPEIHQHHHYTHHPRTEKPPQRVQIPIPLLPTLPPLTFSSPAPFTLQRHIETKRYTKDHQAPPRIIISASASVSDASGRRLNYSLGTIGAAQILKTPPSSYDDYKDSDVGLDPFYHDVPKLNQKRRKRRSAESTEEKINPFEIIKNEKEAVDVLKFLFTWYQSHQATATVLPVTKPIPSDLIQQINHEFGPNRDVDGTLITESSDLHLSSSKQVTSTESLKPGYENSELFKKNGRYSIVGGYRNLDSKPDVYNKNSFKESTINTLEKYLNKTRNGKNIEVEDLATEINSDMPELKEKMDDADVTVVKDLKEAYFNPYDYVDDNYEGVVYKETNPPITRDNKTVHQYLERKEENVENVSDSDKLNKNFSVHPKIVSELYKYFNLNSDVITESSTMSIKELTVHNTNRNIEDTSDYKSDTTTSKNIGNAGNKLVEYLENNKSSLFNDTENPKEPIRLTDITVFSEVHEDHEIPKSSSTTSTSTTTTTTTTQQPHLRQNGRRRGRGRQRQYNNNNTDKQKDRESNFSILSISTETPKTEGDTELKIKELEKNYNDILKEQSSTSRPQIRRSRKRGRSRFVDVYNSTSTTTISPTVKNIMLKETEDSVTTGSPFILVAPIKAVSEFKNTLEILNEPTSLKLKEANFDDNFTGTETTSENYINDQQVTSESSVSGQSDYILEVTSEKEKSLYQRTAELENSFDNNAKNVSPTDILHYDELKYEEVDNIAKSLSNNNDITILKPPQGNIFNDSFTENLDEYTHDDEKDIPTQNLEAYYEAIGTADDASLKVETSTVTSINDETDHSSKNDGSLESSSDLRLDLKPTEDPSYLIKLLRYFAETAMTEENKILITQRPAESYEPLTEYQGTSTQETIIPIRIPKRNRNRFNEEPRNRQRSRHRYSLRVSTTELPTLKDIYQHVKKSEEYNIEPDSTSTPVPDEKLLDILGSVKTNDKGLTNNSNSINIDNDTDSNLNITDAKLDEKGHIKIKSELLERLTLIEQNLTEHYNIDPVTNSPIADTTATTPFVSFEQLESFGTTLSSATNPTNPIEDNTEVTRELAQIFEISSEPNQLFVVREHTLKNTERLYEDVFVVPEITEENLYSPNQVENKNSNDKIETTLISEFTTPYSTRDEDHEKALLPTIEELDVLNPKITQRNKPDSTTTHTTTERYETETPLIINIEHESTELPKNEEASHDPNALLPDVEIQKSISLPVSVLETTFDVSHDINNAQDINDLVSTLTFSDASSTLRTTEKLQEFIQEIEVSTKSVVSKDGQMKLGLTENYGMTATETVPTTSITTEKMEDVRETSTFKYIEEHMKNLKHTILPEVRHNATEILFVKDTESPKTTDNDSTTSLPVTMPIESPGMVNSSHLLQVIVETTTAEPITTISTTTSLPYRTRKTRPPKRRPYTRQRNQFGRHRFSTELFTDRPQKTTDAQYKQDLLSSQIPKKNITEAPLHRSATPTRSELRKVSLLTTPLSSRNSRIPTKVSQHYVFNCFGKDTNRFYADPRDCRLFHYCTQGYSKNQLLDLKFVCDQKTFFDDDKLICTKVKPTRCV